MNINRTTVILSGVFAGTMILTSCGNGDSGADPDAETFRVVALLPQGTDQPYGTTYIPELESEAESLGLDLTITNSQYDADQQASECEVAIASQPDHIILWPAVDDTVAACLTSAEAAGITVTVTNSNVTEADEQYIEAFSGPDTYGQGEASAEMMCELADGDDIGILVVNGLTGNATATMRRDGFSETVADECPNVEILASQPGDWNADDSQIAVSEMLTAVGPDNVDGIFTADDTMAAGAIDALRARDIDPTSLYITSIGNTVLGNPLVENGEIDGTVFQSSVWDGRNAAILAHEVLTGESVEDRLMPSIKVTEENAGDDDVAPEW
jgi:ribose transport system substrate-binding protein